MIIHIFGASGSGTSTLARAIVDRFGFFHMDTDDYFWYPTNPRFTQKRPRQERLSLMLSDIAAHDHIVLSGSLCGWGDTLVPQFDLAIRVVTDTQTRIARIHRREYERFGDRILAGGDMYDQHCAFVDWAASYDDGAPDIRSRAMHDAWQKTLTCPVITVNGNQPIDILLSILHPYIEVTPMKLPYPILPLDKKHGKGIPFPSVIQRILITMSPSTAQTAAFRSAWF